MSDFKKTEQINRELFEVNPSLLMEFFEIYDIANTSEIIRFHGGVNQFTENLFFDGKEYAYLPYEASGFHKRSDGALARPLLKLVNAEGVISSYIEDKDDLVGAKVKRIRTFFKFLDAINFKNYDSSPEEWDDLGLSPDPLSRLRDEEWEINRKVAENKYFLEYELNSPLDLEKAFVPRRQVLNNYCPWLYRGHSCGYSGDPVADSNDGLFQDGLNDRGEWAEGISYSKGDFVFLNIKDGIHLRKKVFVCIEDAVSNSSNKPSVNPSFWASDSCSKSLKGCKLRFKGGKMGNLPFGGFPGTNLF